MIIYSFDCAMKNLGFCCIEIDDKWREKTAELLDVIEKFYANPPETKESIQTEMLNIFRTADSIVTNQFVIKYINVFDLIPNGKAKSQKFGDTLQCLKYVVYCLEKQLPNPDVVLIEYQMNVNDKARGISRYIEEHFTPIGIRGGESSITNITYALNKFPLIAADIPEDQCECTVHIVAPGLKNRYNIDSAAVYTGFLEKYSSNYAANKAHAVHHFKYFLNKFGLSDMIKDCPNKLDDLADAFMMAYAWSKKNKLI